MNNLIHQLPTYMLYLLCILLKSLYGTKSGESFEWGYRSLLFLLLLILPPLTPSSAYSPGPDCQRVSYNLCYWCIGRISHTLLRNEQYMWYMYTAYVHTYVSCIYVWFSCYTGDGCDHNCVCCYHLPYCHCGSVVSPTCVHRWQCCWGWGLSLCIHNWSLCSACLHYGHECGESMFMFWSSTIQTP